jgi:hypothetical protein
MLLQPRTRRPVRHELDSQRGIAMPPESNRKQQLPRITKKLKNSTPVQNYNSHGGREATGR